MNLLEERYSPCKFWEKDVTGLPTHVVVPNFLSEEECDYLMSLQDSQAEVKGTVAETEEYSPTTRGVENNDYRNVDVTWVNWYTDREVYFNVWDRLSAVNDDTFGFQISQMQDIMLCRYAEGQFFTQHYDAFERAPMREFRKLTMTVLLNDPKDFEGSIDIYDGERPTPVPHDGRGSAIIFPAWALHAVEPIKPLVPDGARRVMIAWFVGERYR